MTQREPNGPAPRSPAAPVAAGPDLRSVIVRAEDPTAARRCGRPRPTAPHPAAMVRITVNVTQTGCRATEILAEVSDYLGTEFVPLDRSHGYFRIDDVGPKRTFTTVRAAFDADPGTGTPTLSSTTPTPEPMGIAPSVGGIRIRP